MQFSKSDCEVNFSAKYNAQPSGLGATRASLLRLLRSLDLVGWTTHEESGRLDRKAFTRFAVGSTAVFSKRQHIEAERSAVSVLIDCSGSMSNDGLIETAESVAIQLSRILDKANVEFNVTGFYGNGGREALRASGANKVDVEVRYEKPTFVPFKTWRDSLQKASAKLGSIRHWAQSSTPDYSSISITLEDLGLRTEQRKILFLITDANGYNKTHMRHLQNVADRLGIKLIAIGIGHTDVKECFRSGENVKSVNDLASATFNKLLKELQ
jgi:cobalamin biosynthesis protein CobT